MLLLCINNVNNINIINNIKASIELDNKKKKKRIIRTIHLKKEVDFYLFRLF